LGAARADEGERGEFYKGTDKQTFERFDTEALTRDDRQLSQLVFLLHASRMVPLHAPSHLDALVLESEKVGRDLTIEFYAHYAFARRSTLSRLRWTNPDVEPRLILGCAQKLLDRILFIAFCEDRGLLPAETIKRAFGYRDPNNPRPLWDNFRGMFRAVNLGNPELSIHKYNGGLFADDPVLDGLKIPDEFWLFRDLAEYDFRPPSVVADTEIVSDSRLIDVEILGHIFEQSINDLEKLQAELENPVEAAAVRELRGFAELFDLDRKILQENLYGVDLNEEAVHIAKLSLWIKTAVPGKVLTSLDHNCVSATASWRIARLTRRHSTGSPSSRRSSALKVGPAVSTW